MLKLLFIIGVVAAVIILVNTVLRSGGGKGLFGFSSSSASDQTQTGRPLETVPNLIPKRP